MAMKGVDLSIEPSILAEIKDPRSFHSSAALIAYSEIDAPPYQSENLQELITSISKIPYRETRSKFNASIVQLQCWGVISEAYQSCHHLIQIIYLPNNSETLCLPPQKNSPSKSELRMPPSPIHKIVCQHLL